LSGDKPVEAHTPPRFFVEPAMVLGNQIVLTGDLLRHARAQRLSPGETFKAVQGETVYTAEVAEVLADRLVGSITGHTRATPPAAKVHLYASLLKGQNFDLVVEKATEIGVFSNTPVVTRRTIPRLEGDKAEERRSRWQKVAKAASEQSGRGQVPEIREVTEFDRLMAGADDILGTRLLAYEHEGMTVPLDEALLGATQASIIVGPEGGLDASEVELALKRSFVPISLGPYIMKAETASIAAVSLLIHHLSKQA
jgi:16S rRNA (uracil1498-N3)-methyltransferase